MTLDSETRLFTEESLAEGAVVGATPNQAHYLRAVLRLQAGALVTLFNGRDGEWLGRIDGIGKSWASLSLERQLREQQAVPALQLIFAPVKKTRLDMIVEKATELGATVIQPVLTERTNVSQVRVPRLQATALEAAEQSERLEVPEVREPVKLAQLLQDWPADQPMLVCAEAGAAEPIRDVLTSLDKDAAPAFIVGPEGGFSARELETLARCPFVRLVGLGPRVLRAETAALAALACWQSVCGDWGDRPPHRA